MRIFVNILKTDAAKSVSKLLFKLSEDLILVAITPLDPMRERRKERREGGEEKEGRRKEEANMPT